MTGSGKTTFSRKLLHTYRVHYGDAPIYILDTKQSGDFRGWKGAVFTEEAPLAIPYGMQVWQPPIDNFAQFDAWFRNIFNARIPAIVMVDELSSIGKGVKEQAYPRHFQIMLKQGRALGICVIVLTQEVAKISRQVLNQLSHLLRFRLLDSYDAMVMDKKLGRRNRADGREDDLGEPPDEYGFFYARLDKGGVTNAFYYPSYERFF